MPYKDIEKRRESSRRSAAKVRDLNPELCRKRTERWRESNRERVRETRQRWLKANRDSLREYRRVYRELNSERNAEYMRSYRAANRENARVLEQRKRERMKQLIINPRAGSYTPAEDAIILRADLTIVEMACILQRTYCSVSKRRRKLCKRLKPTETGH